MANPKVFTWQAPTVSEDGTAIDYPLNYELGEADADGNFQPLVSIVGTLQDDHYEAPVSDMTWTPGNHTVALRAINGEDTSKVSPWSNSVTFLWSDRVPSAPLAFSVA